MIAGARRRSTVPIFAAISGWSTRHDPPPDHPPARADQPARDAEPCGEARAVNVRVPQSVTQLQRKSAQFRDFLQARGSQLLAPTNPYEVLRFIGSDGSPCVVYRKDSGILKWSIRAVEAYEAFASGSPWRAIEKVKRSAGKKKRFQMLKTLADSDGSACFYCASSAPLKEMTVEHFVPVSAGGPNHISNMAIACRACNAEAGHLCVAEKLMLAMSKRGEA